MAFKNIEGKFTCEICGKEFTKTQSLRAHKGSHVAKKFKRTIDGKRIAWNKGLTIDDPRIKKQSETNKKRRENGELTNFWKGKKLPEDMKNKISKSMSKAHQEGRAHNIGKSRWNSKQSYPESFFEKVIINEFSDKNYKTEFNIGIYSIDFAWPEKKLAIEIDGQQHERFKEYKERDCRKDKYLQSEGWKVLRISWREMCNNTKEYINKAKVFIEENNERIFKLEMD